jgi:glycosyltransferase involved in cell wall biosynthesis
MSAVAYLVSRYPAVSHTFVLREVLALRRRGVDVHTVSMRRASDDELLSAADRDEAARTFNVLPASTPKVLSAHLAAFARSPGAYLRTLGLALSLRAPGARAALWQLFYFGEAVIVWRHCHRQGIRHLHAHLANVAADVALLATAYANAREAQRPWSWSFTMHGPTEFYDVEMHRLPEKVRDAGYVVCISDFARSQLMGMVDQSHWRKLHVVHCGVDENEFAPVGPNAGGGVRILTVGRLVSVKGHAVLLRALAELRKRGVDAMAEIVGGGPEREPLERLAADLGLGEAAKFHGAVGQDEIRDVYARATLFCLPSFAEGVPVVLMEAMAMGLPVVSCAVMGIPELVEDDRSGLLVPPGREDLLADALERLARDEELRRRLGEGGREKVLREFSLDDSAAQLADLFGEAERA